MVITAIFAYIYWFLLAIPVGAIQIEIARRVFNGYVKSALAIVWGSVFSDLIYGVVALLGVFHFLANPKIRPFFLAGWQYFAGDFSCPGVSPLHAPA